MVLNPTDAVHNAHLWFEHNSGWAPPDAETLAEWMSDGVCRCPDDCLVAPDGWCEHGLASWWLVLSSLDEAPGPRQWPEPHPSRLDPDRDDYGVILAAHERAVAAAEPGYLDPTSGLFVMTAKYLWDRGSCCDQGCRHCPFLRR